MRTKQKIISLAPRIILFFGIIISLAIRFILIFKGADTADVGRMHEVGMYVLSGHNPYQIPDFYIYPPVWMYFEAFTKFISINVYFPFHFIIKLWPLLGDVATTYLLYKILIKNNSPLVASIWSTIYFLNPISILISSSHGQFDSLVILFTLLSVYLLTNKRIYLSGLSLGISIALKTNPLMILPYLFLILKEKIHNKVIYILITVLPIVLSLTPYLFNNFGEVLKSITNYSGVYDIGLMALVRGIYYQINANYWLYTFIKVASVNKYPFLIGAIFLSYVFYKNKTDIYKSVLAIYLLFIVSYLGISAQYLTWIIPFAIIRRDKNIIYYFFLGAISIISFYLFSDPQVLFGLTNLIQPHLSTSMSIYFFTNLFFWVFAFIWLLEIIFEEAKIFISVHSNSRKVVLIEALIIYLISLIPTIVWVGYLFSTVS